MIYNRPLKDCYSFSNSNSLNDEFIPFLLGRNAFNYLISSLEIKTIFLPSFICSMVVDIFKNAGVEIIFYESLDSKLKVPKNLILELVSTVNTQGNTYFLWHDYLSLIGDIPRELYEILEKRNIKTIIDATHSLPSKKYQCANIIYGFRKLLNQPFGALLKTDEHQSLPNNELPKIKLLNFLLFHKVQSIIFNKLNNSIFDDFLKKISIFGDRFSFDKNDYFMSESYNYNKILDYHKRIDYKKINKKRSELFLHYFNNLPQQFNISNFEVNCPYGFPLLVKNNKKVRSILWDAGIHTFILWGTLHEDVLENNNIGDIYLTNSVLILPVNQDLTFDDINTIIRIINAL